MGFVHVNVGLSNPSEPGRTEEVRVLVDTGATLSVLPASLLERLRIRRIGQRRFRGFGGVVTRDVGYAIMRYEGVEAGVTVAFGDETDPAVMGVTALESMGYDVDPTVGELHRVDMLI
jgi:predicted aspartyl protease